MSKTAEEKKAKQGRADIPGSLIEELEEMKAYAYDRATRNYFWAFGAAVWFVITTAGATVVIASVPPTHKWAIAAAAVLPSVAGSLLQICKWDARSAWWWRRYHVLADLLRKLKYEDISESFVSELLGRYLTAAEDSYPGYNMWPMKRSGEKPDESEKPDKDSQKGSHTAGNGSHAESGA